MNLNQRFHIRIHAELDRLSALGILNENQAGKIKERYPTTAGDYVASIRAFSVLGALTAIAGLIILVSEHLNGWLITESSLALIGMGLLVLGHWLRVRKSLPTVGQTAELMGSIAVHGLMGVLAGQYLKDGKNWSAVEGAAILLLTLLAYAVANRLVLWYACANFFFWFGAETGYAAGWGCYWLGMTYPVRFLAAGFGMLLLSWTHLRIVRGRWAVFGRVYAHFGLLVINLALWFLAVFGYYEDYDIDWSDTQGERLLFSLLWAAVSGGSLFAGARFGLQLLRGYGLTFLILNLYTFYFQFVVAHTGEAWFLHLLLTGGSLLGLGLYLERNRREKKPSSAET